MIRLTGEPLGRVLMGTRLGEPNIEVRGATGDDVSTLRASWPAKAVWDGHEARAAAGAADFLIAWEDDLPIGVALVQWSGPVGDAARAAFPEAVEINHLHVRDHHRGRGIGSRLVEEAERLCVARGVRTAMLAVDADNGGALALYLRLGYRPTGVVDECTYEYLDGSGVHRTATETSEALVKELADPAHDRS